MAGLPVSVVELADQILGWEYIEGLTFSGGEPFEQASAISQLVTMIRQHRDISVMVYTGYTFNELKKSPDPGVNVFLEQIDLLVDGPFIEGKQDNLLWRGSSNQQIHLLTDRYGEWCDRIDGPGEGVEVHVSRLGNVFWAGVPEPGFHNNLKELLRQEGISLQDTEGVWV
jgi:anaerobic ribonucleoside-triphosphate reductase activating protein